MVQIQLHKADDIFKYLVFDIKRKILYKVQLMVMDELWDKFSHTNQIRIKIKEEYENN